MSEIWQFFLTLPLPEKRTTQTIVPPDKKTFTVSACFIYTTSQNLVSVHFIYSLDRPAGKYLVLLIRNLCLIGNTRYQSKVKAKTPWLPGFKQLLPAPDYQMVLQEYPFLTVDPIPAKCKITYSQDWLILTTLFNIVQLCTNFVHGSTIPLLKFPIDPKTQD